MRAHVTATRRASTAAVAVAGDVLVRSERRSMTRVRLARIQRRLKRAGKPPPGRRDRHHSHVALPAARWMGVACTDGMSCFVARAERCRVW